MGCVDGRVTMLHMYRCSPCAWSYRMTLVLPLRWPDACLGKVLVLVLLGRIYVVKLSYVQVLMRWCLACPVTGGGANAEFNGFRGFFVQTNHVQHSLS